MKTIGIVGSRRRDSDKDLEECRIVFEKYYKDGDILVSGGCPQGGDRFCEIFANELGLTEENGKLIIHRAEWSKYGRRAGFKRNTYIAEDADIVIAVAAYDRTGGTEDTIKKAKKLEKTVVIVPNPCIREQQDKWIEDFNKLII